MSVDLLLICHSIHRGICIFRVCEADEPESAAAVRVTVFHNDLYHGEESSQIPRKRSTSMSKTY